MTKRLLVLLLFVASATLLAHAGRIEISEPDCQPGDTDVFSLSNGFAAIPVAGGGTFHYCNKTGVDWTNLLMIIQTTAPASDVQCPSYNPFIDPLNNNDLAFAFCFVSQAQTNVVNALFVGTFPPLPFFGFHGFLGVPDEQRFTVDLDCHDFGGCHPWPEGTAAYGFANVDPFNLPTLVPEPTSLALLATGLAGVIFRRRRKI